MTERLTRRTLCQAGALAAAGMAAAGLASQAGAVESAVPTGGQPAPENPVPAGPKSVSVATPYDIFQAELDASSVELGEISDFAEEASYDVVVVGAGTAGVPAAIAAFEEGASVAVLQKQTMPVAQGMLAARVVKEESTEVGIAEYVHDMLAINDYRPDLSLLKAFADQSGEAEQWYFDKLAEIGFEDMGESDSKNHVYDDGNCQVRGMLFKGSMLAPTQALAEKAEADGVKFYYATPAVQLVVEDGAVTGVIGKAQDGGYVKLNAAKGVILATGDYQNNEPMVAHYCPDAQEFNRKQSEKTGDGHLMGLAAGAVMEPGVHAKMIHGGRGCFRNEPFLAVNLNGERFMFEDILYERRNTILRDQPGHLMYSIFDANYTEQVTGWGHDPTVPTVANGKPEQIEQFVESGVLLSADTLEELAVKMEVPADTFAATVERYNDLCEQGQDVDFGKASKYMQPLTTPPYYAMLRDFQIAAIPAGLVIDANGQCKDAEGGLIPGLFAAGNCSGPFYSDVDYSLDTMGLSVGRCLTFGYITGRHVASL